MVTRHGDRRTRERMGIPRSAVKRMAAKAMTEGFTRQDCSGSLRRYLDFLYHYNETANNIRVWSEKVWIFSDNYLITVLDLPTRYRNAANSLLAKKGAENNDEV